MLIDISGMKLKIIVGVFPIERKRKQKIYLDIQIDYDADLAAATDDVKNALNYKSLIENIETQVRETKFYLLESLVAFIGEIILSNSLARSVAVKAAKGKIFKNVDRVSVTYQKSKV
ncbi:MAG TPA: dihydroneopterin aldolase [Spirochaetota bacterium]|nr:dihydroneopterin aldolase [Spirochaetota bacterium]HOS32330.1 dihydroneopterin aldolase [Spirochaetota bacterium]HOS54427.1 dihydroneopterin aldolase [Spirochaetota bacterium]HPK61200.1 dihydroneopterin aldolase [Spirochaetota bacterium]HQF76920.1 dihydroneopterin aldolase [Spirochaetota bacterium]